MAKQPNPARGTLAYDEPIDAATWMLREGLRDLSKHSKHVVYDANCYICNDSEFAIMGLPLCFHCHKCGGHVAADDTLCAFCGHDHMQGSGHAH